MKRLALSILALIVLGSATTTPAHAQTTTLVNPRIVEFDPSADHAAVGADGQPLVQRYELRIFMMGATEPVTATDLGKPGPEADGKIRVDFATRLTAWPPNGDYEARVAAVGPAGNGVSDPSNAFSLVSAAATCAYALSTPQSFLAGGGVGSVTLTTTAGCAWTASSDAAWVTPGTGSGTGPATISIIAAANTTTSPRTATLTIGGKSVTVSQAGVVPCSYAASPTALSVGAGGGTSSVMVTAGSACAWTVASAVPWVTPGTLSGAGAGAVTLTVASNPATTSRTATVTVAGQPIAISQAAAPCTFSLSAASGTIPAAGGSGNLTVTSGAGCGWTATSSAAWATVTPAAGSGVGAVTFSATPNALVTARTATLTIAGKSYSLTQAGAPCSYTLTPTTITAMGYSATGSIGVASSAGCAWTASTANSWITLATTGGTANGIVSYSLERNSTKAVRTGTVVIAGKTCTITQSIPPSPTAPKKPRVEK